MATKKSGMKRTGRAAMSAGSPLEKLSRRERVQLERLTRKARADIAALLKESSAGTLTRRDLEAKLKEIEEGVKILYPFGFAPR